MDFLRLRRHKMMQILKQSLPSNISKSLNVLTVQDSVLFSWDFESHCVLTLNVKATINVENHDSIICQKLLPVRPPVFSPEKILANEINTLLIVAGRNGVLVFHLPHRSPPYGAFSNNKELVYCRTHSLDERLLVCNENVDMLQVRFHPGSLYNNHILLLTSDNMLRLYKIDKEVINLGTFSVGDKPSAMLPGSKMSFLGALGETAIDFDFGHPEDNPNKVEKPKPPGPMFVSLKKPPKVVETKPKMIEYHGRKDDNSEREKERDDYELFNWPVYVLFGDYVVTCLNIPLYETTETVETHSVPITPSEMLKYDRKACSIICLNSSPQVVCIGSSNGEILHGLILPEEVKEIATVEMIKKEKDEKKPFMKREIFLFEALDIELGLTTTNSTEGYNCPIFLHKDEARCDVYYATHAAGLHSISITCLEDFQGKLTEIPDDAFSLPSIAEYLICTKTSTSKGFNPVVGFATYYDPNSVITLLANGNLLSLAIMTPSVAPKIKNDNDLSSSEEGNKFAFVLYIQNLLKKESHPILKLSNEDHSLQECHELIQRTAQIFKEKFKQHMTVKEQIEKRYTALKICTDYQVVSLGSMMKDKQELQEKAESVAERYEDLREKQEILLKRAAKLLIMLAMKKEVLSDAENDYLKKLAVMRKKLDSCDAAIEKIIQKRVYQDNQIRIWKNEHNNKNSFMNDTHSDTIKDTLVTSSIRINQMVEEINRIKKLLNLK